MVFNPIWCIFCSLYPSPQNVALAQHVPEMIRFIHVAILPMVPSGVIHHFLSSNVGVHGRELASVPCDAVLAGHFS